MSLTERTNEAVQLLRQMIATPSTSRDEEAVGNLIESFLQKKGYKPNRKGNNIWISTPHDESKPTLLLNAHIDTVKPVSAWTLDPFSPSEQDGAIYGLGSNDDGASVVSLMQAFFFLSQKEQPYNLIFLASCEEEVSGKNGIESVLPELGKIDVALVGEPTGMQPAIAEKGLMVIDATAYGKAGHAARNEGDNAIYKVLDDIKWLSTHQFEKVSPELGPVKTTVTIINAGTQHNVIPDKCTFTIDVRSNECYTNEELFEEIRRNIKSEPVARSFRLNSSKISTNHPLAAKAIRMGKTPFGSPTLSDQALMHFPSMKMGPGESSRSHTANEFIKISEIEEAIATYIELLDQLDISKT